MGMDSIFAIVALGSFVFGGPLAVGVLYAIAKIASRKKG
jgi:hypothetical protein